MPGRVEGKVAFITGAARGQGRSHAVRLAEEGADIIAIDICEPVRNVNYDFPTEADLAETARLVEQLDRRIVTHKVDIRDSAGLKAAVDDGVAQLGRLDIVSANAAIGVNQFPSWEIPDEEWQDMVDINLTGQWRTCKAAIPHMIEGGRGGSIALTSSMAALRTYQFIGHYSAAKHGVVGLMATMAVELGKYNIRVNSLLPTQVATPMIHNEAMYRNFRPDLENPTQEDMAEPSKLAHALDLPWVEAIDVSNALLYLASDEARYITGVTFPVAAGANVT
ncbi:mycofactocin-coupled SDR family oxidoreductase [Trujillonella endophytica]|uniref:(+)-trans-carveol dehydrogenase n=1 Tax=Trujillonella endophytica TaxID=673521 RepID=A0A1H8QUY0_9ACTN|nr:mycofactocin-coupled SDR family oxidoreductase [Trujillella endophytica]SEO57664.1 (+)-trans-carveol dehydrogenase [Trujillella endophytica]